MKNLTNIPKAEQESALSSFWTMLQECDTTVANSKDKDGVFHEPVLKHWVEQWYTQWNRITNSDNAPSWLRN